MSKMSKKITDFMAFLKIKNIQYFSLYFEFKIKYYVPYFIYDHLCADDINLGQSKV